MRILLDTHAWLWWISSPAKLNQPALALLSDPGTTVCLSAGSIWEVVIKHAAGKLTLPVTPAVLVTQAFADDGWVGLPIEPAHSLHVAQLPSHHRDPFDRILIAQAVVEGIPILTADRRFSEYRVQVITAD